MEYKRAFISYPFGWGVLGMTLRCKWWQGYCSEVL